MCVNKLTKIAIIFFAFTVAGLGFLHAVPTEAQAWKIDHRELKLFRKAMQKIQEDYAREVKDKELINGAINGMLQSLDPHSSYLTEDLFKELQVETKGEFGGLGIEITLENGILTVVSPIEDTPAFKAGLMPGDRIIKIAGEDTKNITLMEAVKRMRGPRGTKITITVVRNGKKPEDYTITRDIIHVQSVKTQLLEKGYPYIRLVSFQENTVKDLGEAVKKHLTQGQLKGLMLDLRNNPGGLLEQAVKVSNLFIDKGLIVYTDGRTGDQRMEFRASRTGEHYQFKVAVLINGGSASASEIVAGCLQDHQRALLFGEKSFGKASVQTIIPLENGGALRLTTAYYYTPRGRHIQKKGIQPDVDMKTELEKQREQELAKENQDKSDKKKQSWRTGKVDPAKDLPVAKALKWLKSGQTVEQFREEHEDKAKQETARAPE
ncbi:MAG: S41 family peptidase [Thermodesulfobacteriota bacterium]